MSWERDLPFMYFPPQTLDGSENSFCRVTESSGRKKFFDNLGANLSVFYDSIEYFNVYCASGRNGVRDFAVYIIVIEDLEASVGTTSY